MSDVFLGKRTEGYDQNMAVNYVRHAIELERMNEQEIVSVFNSEISKAVRYFHNKSEVAQKLIDLHMRHASYVKRVIDQQIQNNAGDLVDGKLEKTCMLALIAGQKHLASSWVRFADKIAKILQSGVPIACQTEKPKNEPRLQEICDGILKGNDEKLEREFPFQRWSSVSTKPDWSAEDLWLWVELKYIRKKEDIGIISEAISSDITKYGDINRRVLYLVYDPSHLILDEDKFKSPLNNRPSMMMRFIR